MYYHVMPRFTNNLPNRLIAKDIDLISSTTTPSEANTVPLNLELVN